MEMIAERPPMGWNSWDCYGASVDEETVKRNAEYISEHMKSSGWRYVVVDIQWYEPTADGSAYKPFADLCMDEYGRLIPAENRFPSSKGGEGFRPLADYIHGLGLKFGIHIMRGIPRQAVAQNTKIVGSNARAREIAHPYSICPWNTDMYGVRPNAPGAQDYYNSLFSLYARWTVDFVKVDDISYTDFGKDIYAGRYEIEMISAAIAACKRPMVLSLSCGPAPIEQATHLMKYSNMWRLSADMWDRWEDIVPMFERCAEWSRYSDRGHWPDADMLPFGHISVRGSEHGIGDRYTRLSHTEQITMMTLWCILRSPLMFGGECTDNDEFTLSLLNNKGLLRVNQYGRDQEEIYRGGIQREFVIWRSYDDSEDAEYIALFNLSDRDNNYQITKEIPGAEGFKTVTDLWTGAEEKAEDFLSCVKIKAHGSRMLSVN
jgi:alpha-galactosidase